MQIMVDNGDASTTITTITTIDTGPANERTADWYSQPLRTDDILAGGFLLTLGLIFLPLYAAVSYVMFRQDKDIVGFRFLFSASLADMLLLVNYAVWPGITILLKSEVVTPSIRHWLQCYMDWAWFSMCYHYCLVAWSRFAAIGFANSFRTQSRAASYAICASCYLLALIQVLCTHFQPWYVTFYYEPSAYGMMAEDFPKYLHGGQSLFFLVFHLLMMVIPVLFYACALVLLLRHREATGRLFNATSISNNNISSVSNHTTCNGEKSSPPSSSEKSGGKNKTGSASRTTRMHSFLQRRSALNAHTEARLIIPCVLNSVVFVFGQIFITIGTGTGKWASWMVLVLFSFNSAVNPLLLLGFSAIIRRRTFVLLTTGRYMRSGAELARYNSTKRLQHLQQPPLSTTSARWAPSDGRSTTAITTPIFITLRKREKQQQQLARQGCILLGERNESRIGSHHSAEEHLLTPSASSEAERQQMTLSCDLKRKLSEPLVVTGANISDEEA